MAARDPHGPVALFDSGVGGLTVLHECLVQIPHEDFLYLGDTARFPYGERSLDELRAFAQELAGILVDAGAKMLVVACNSATSASMPQLREDLAGTLDVISVVRPEAALAARLTTNGHVGLLATPATVASGAYQRALAATAPQAELQAVGSAELAPLIQREGDWWDQALVDCVDRVCEPLIAAGVDTVILGCTHYPLVRPILQRRLGRGVRVVTSGEAIAEEVHTALVDDGLARDDEARRGDYSFMCSGDPGEFERIGGRFLQMPLGQVRHVDVRGSSKAAA
ncbi:MAG: glutamate racemase [Thermoleophilaceae bacterium]